MDVTRPSILLLMDTLYKSKLKTKPYSCFLIKLFLSLQRTKILQMKTLAVNPETYMKLLEITVLKGYGSVEQTISELIDIATDIDNSLKENKFASEVASKESFKHKIEIKAVRENVRKKSKVNLKILVSAGLLIEGQELILVDYSGNAYPDFTCFIRGKDVEYRGQRYSMSNLAKLLLKKLGYSSNSVRGTEHWITNENKTILEIWNSYLTRQT